ncbi:MAG: hypothetical protein R3256_09190, partial [Thalassovita sp.]|nr:hypothetical protein [Thalassovita sp.]
HHRGDGQARGAADLIWALVGHHVTTVAKAGLCPVSQLKTTGAEQAGLDAPPGHYSAAAFFAPAGL